MKDTRRYLSILGNLVLWAIIAIDAWFLWPTTLGGNTTLIIVAGESMEPTFHSGDLVVARVGVPEVGDVIVYEPPNLDGSRLVHRIIGGNAEDGWIIQGDNNSFLDPWQPTDESIVGVVHLHFPKVGLVGSLLMSPWTWGFFLIIASALVLWPDRDDEDEDDDEDVRVLANWGARR